MAQLPPNQPNGHLGADRARTPYPNQVKEHRLKITDSPHTYIRGFNCSCGCPIGAYSLNTHSQKTERQLSHTYVRSWEKHSFNQRYDALGPTPRAVTIWAEPLEQWQYIPWDIYTSRRLVIYKKRADNLYLDDGREVVMTEQIILHPAPGNPLIWTTDHPLIWR